MSSKEPPVKKSLNILVVAVIVLAAAVLILIANGQRSGSAGPSQKEIDQQIAALATPTHAPASTPVPAEPTEVPAPQEAAESYLFVIVNNRVQGIYPLNEERDVTVDQGDGKVNVIHLQENGFSMASSTCDNQLCVEQGEVTVDNYQRRILGTSVLCLPNNVDLELVVPSHTPDPNAPDI